MKASVTSQIMATQYATRMAMFAIMRAEPDILRKLTMSAIIPPKILAGQYSRMWRISAILSFNGSLIMLVPNARSHRPRLCALAVRKMDSVPLSVSLKINALLTSRKQATISKFMSTL